MAACSRDSAISAKWNCWSRPALRRLECNSHRHRQRCALRKQLDRIGTIQAGKQADLVVLKGDPSEHIGDIENVEIVFKDAVGYDPAKLINSVRGMVGTR